MGWRGGWGAGEGSAPRQALGPGHPGRAPRPRPRALPRRRPAASPPPPGPAPRLPVTPSPAPLSRRRASSPLPPALPPACPARSRRAAAGAAQKRDAPSRETVLPAPARPGPATPPLPGLLAEGGSGPARASSAGPRGSSPPVPQRSGRKERGGGAGGAPAAAASRLRPPVATGRAAATLPSSLPPCPSLCSPGPRRVFTCRDGAERGPGASGSRRRRRTPSRCCRPRVRRAGRSRDLPWEALRKPAAAAAPSATEREGGRSLRHPATGLSAPADRAAGSSPYPSAQRAARIPPACGAAPDLAGRPGALRAGGLGPSVPLP